MADLYCAFCGDSLIAIRDVGIEIDRCGRCKAIWFDSSELETYAASRGHKPIRPAQVAPESDGLHLKCPRCARESLYQGRVLGITAWHCSTCNGLALEPASLAALASRSRSVRLNPGTRSENILTAPELGEFGLALVEVVLDLLSGLFDP